MNKPSRTLVIGDIHGGLKALLQCLERCQYDKEYDQLIFLGDYTDGWSETAQLIEFLIDLESQAIHKPIFLRGNHDEVFEDWLETGTHSWNWIQGALPTIESYAKLIDHPIKVHTTWSFNTFNQKRYRHEVDMNPGQIPESHIKFFKSMHNYYVDDQNRGFVHGGFKSKLGLGNEHSESDYYWDRDMWGLAVMAEGRTHLTEDSTPHSYRFLKHKEVYIGHTSTISHKVKPGYKEYEDPRQPKNGGIMIPMNRCNVWNMDTGGGWHGKVSVMDIDTKEFWQSDIVKELYPDDPGRT